MSIKVGIIGGAGYTGGELLRLLIHHPEVEISYVHSNSNGGASVYSVHKDLIGETELAFASELHFDLDAIFLCMGHGASKIFLEENKVPASVKIIDLSQDFRITDPSHDFVYGLPEMQKEAVKAAQNIANPGCFATCIQLAILPLASKQALSNPVHINAITGSTGAGQKPTATSHFSWRNNNISVYKAFNHQHLKEIKQSLKSLQADSSDELNFIPVRGNFTRGIYATCYTETELSEEELVSLYKDYYKDSPFVHVTDSNPDLKQVVNTNKGIVFVEKHGDKALIVSMIDNLLKGASGQALQNMNLMFGLDERMGLNLKPAAF
ncbi:N-acetyl-gamma-glutamyl-phosphate reductase [Flammeovirgaceae bacterium SG7u.111]|nr:N-acetyl-gamma-glutamyl-phosphate reductase [Flammeovirgaceae bacterium SG7u.132]WPO38573.1 N-acetyl-gamma-glutamyl-phosphate reductase [Flammeovirgaceae bacterium SG7u.111]